MGRFLWLTCPREVLESLSHVLPFFIQEPLQLFTNHYVIGVMNTGSIDRLAPL